MRLQVNSDISNKLAMWLSRDNIVNTFPIVLIDDPCIVCCLYFSKQVRMLCSDALAAPKGRQSL